MHDERHVSGHDAAWRAYRAELYRFVRARVETEAAAEDLVHDVLARAWAHRETLRSPGKLRSWLYRIARNAIIDHYRKRRPVVAVPEGGLADEGTVDGDRARKELARCITPLVRQPRAPYRKALVLYEFEGVPQREVAESSSILAGGSGTMHRTDAAIAVDDGPDTNDHRGSPTLSATGGPGRGGANTHRKRERERHIDEKKNKQAEGRTVDRDSEAARELDAIAGNGEESLDGALRDRLAGLQTEGRKLWNRFDEEVRRHEWHPFMPADYPTVLRALLRVRGPKLRFLEWGSATGVITIMADMLGFEAYGIEIDPDLTDMARELAAKFDSGARFAAGSFVPAGYEWTSDTGDRRLGTIGHGTAGYCELGHSLADFDVVFGYPWNGEEPIMHDVMRRHGGSGARLLLPASGGVHVYVGGRRQN